MNPQRASPAFREHFKVSACLRSFHNSESIFLLRNGQVICVVTSDLQKHTTVWSALVSLTGRVQKARPEAETSSDPSGISYHVTQPLQLSFVRIVHRYVGQ